MPEDAPPAPRPGSAMSDWRAPRSVGEYALIGDLHTVAMVSADASIDWLCLPRFDSPACFAAMLGTADNGHWSVHPTGPVRSRRRSYRADTLILETEFVTAAGRATVIDFMPPRDGQADLVRIVRGEQGSVAFGTEIRIRCDYGRIVPWVRHVEGGIAAVAGPDAVYVRSTVELTGRGEATVAEFTVAAGEQVCFVLSRTPSHLDEPPAVDPDAALADTERYWREWLAGCSYTGRWSEQVRRSLITLKALTYRPTGGIVAAATTSLPEKAGGPRNWDYRYCWLRDSTFALEALVSCGYTAEAGAWRHWLLRAVGGDPSGLQVLYAVDGSRRIPEQQLDWLDGFVGSRPVRIGNAAAGQFQLDIFGEVLDTLEVARSSGITDHPDRPRPADRIDSAWPLQRLLLEQVAGIWEQPDDGLWEVRSERRHFVHSKVMAWVAFDRMITGAREHGLPGPVADWQRTADRIRDEVCSRGLDPGGRHFVQSYGSDRLDAALLLLPRVGFLPWDDPRIVATVHAVRAALTDDAGFVRRYQPSPEDARGAASADGLTGGEGSFLACSFWMVDALAGIGELPAAEELFERLLLVANDVGLIAEEYDPATGTGWGNTPQAYSHVGLINAARRLEGTGVNRDRPPARSEPAPGH